MRSKPFILALCLLIVIALTSAIPAANAGKSLPPQAAAAQKQQTQSTDGIPDCVDVTLEQPYEGRCLTESGKTLKVEVSATGIDEAANDSAGTVRREGKKGMNAVNVKPAQAPSDNESDDGNGTPAVATDRKPRGIFSGISNAADRAVSVVSAVFSGNKPPKNPKAAEPARNRSDADDDADGIVTDTSTGEEYFVHVTGLIDEIKEDDTVLIAIDAAHPDANLKKGDRVALIGFQTEDSGSLGLIADYDGKAVIGRDQNDTDDEANESDDASESVVLGEEHVGLELESVWEGDFHLSTGNGSVLVDWWCDTGDFDATAYYGPDTEVTRTGSTGDGQHPASLPVSHVGFMDDTTPAVAPDSSWQVSSDHQDQKAPSACTATIASVTDAPVLREPETTHESASVIITEGEVQIAAASRATDGNAAVYRLVTGDLQVAQVAYGSLYLDDGAGGERTATMYEDEGTVRQVTVQDERITNMSTIERDTDLWHPDILSFADQLHAATYTATVTTNESDHTASVRATSDADSTVTSYEWRVDGIKAGVATVNETNTTTAADGSTEDSITLLVVDGTGSQVDRTDLIGSIAASHTVTAETAEDIVDALLAATTDAIAEREGNGGIDLGIKTKS